MNKETLLNELDKFFIDDIAEKILYMVIFTPKTNEELQTAVNEWCINKGEAEKKYYHILRVKHRLSKND